MMQPPTSAPGIEVSPPRISTGSALSASPIMVGSIWILVPQTVAATNAVSPESDHTITHMRLSGMPTDIEAVWSSATARSAWPILE